jgi:hypothetical protein
VDVHSSDPSSWSPPATLRDHTSTTLINARRSPQKEPNAELADVEEELKAAHVHFGEVLRERPALWIRLFDALGYKTHERSELEQFRLAPAKSHEDNLIFGVDKALCEALEAHGFTWALRSEFSQWDDVARHVVASFEALEARTHHRYEAVAYLNAPLIDHEGPIDLGLLDGANPRSVVRIEYASDERLAQAIGYTVRDRVSEGVRGTNAVLTFPLTVEVDAPGEVYLRAYPYAADVIASVVDVLRIAHSGDIGVGALRLVGAEAFTPTIRRTFAWSYEPEVTLYQVRRLAFGIPSDQVLTDEEIEVVRRLLPVHLAGLQQQGFDVAIRRFRDSYERYHPSDPGKAPGHCDRIRGAAPERQPAEGA